MCNSNFNFPNAFLQEIQFSQAWMIRTNLTKEREYVNIVLSLTGEWGWLYFSLGFDKLESQSLLSPQ